MNATETGAVVTEAVLAPSTNEPPRSAASWSAILAGAAAAAGATLILLVLGSGLGFAVSSPWPGVGPSLGTFTVVAGIWLIVTQWIASGLGGYVAGRLRTRWTSTHTHEVFFRDTAHGLVVWSVATVVVAVVAVFSTTVAVGAGAAAAGSADYEADTLLRTAHGDERPSAATTRAEVTRLLARSVTKSGLTAEDRSYLDAVVIDRTGLSPADAHNRVEATLTAARRAADDARKAASATAFFTALSMLIGAFIACVSAALGGRLRDEHP